jgi:hypothetical protein
LRNGRLRHVVLLPDHRGNAWLQRPDHRTHLEVHQEGRDRSGNAERYLDAMAGTRGVNGVVDLRLD